MRWLLRAAKEREPDIILHAAEGAIVGKIPGLRGREATERVIAQLLDGTAWRDR